MGDIGVPLVMFHNDKEYLIGYAVVDPEAIKKTDVQGDPILVVPEDMEIRRVTATNFMFQTKQE